MNIKNLLYHFSFSILTLYSCYNNRNYNSGLLSDDKQKIIKACSEIGKKRDISYVKNLLNNSLDPRITHNIKYKGASINNIRLKTLQRVSNFAYKAKN